MASARRRARNKIHGVARRRQMSGPLSQSKRNCERKLRYESERIANIRADQMAVKFPDEPPQRAYRCPHCKGWHLTKRP